MRAGRDLGPLHGIPIAVKDLVDTEGVRTTCASRILADRVPDRDASIATRLREAGGACLGKTIMPEFPSGFNSSRRPEPTRSAWRSAQPWNPFSRPRQRRGRGTRRSAREAGVT
ncbi:amidase family protein [Deinococcus yavapaiensis]|uniref:amidase family protein n=1 Tax=Deinococcus yavapaiensis TaxID=309889 RepID=UPI001B871870|nr:amidase family protein [Deinococcus yavapaiensis]